MYLIYVVIDIIILIQLQWMVAGDHGNMENVVLHVAMVLLFVLVNVTIPHQHIEERIVRDQVEKCCHAMKDAVQV